MRHGRDRQAGRLRAEIRVLAFQQRRLPFGCQGDLPWGTARRIGRGRPATLTIGRGAPTLRAGTERAQGGADLQGFPVQPTSVRTLSPCMLRCLAILSVVSLN